MVLLKFLQFDRVLLVLIFHRLFELIKHIHELGCVGLIRRLRRVFEVENAAFVRFFCDETLRRAEETLGLGADCQGWWRWWFCPYRIGRLSGLDLVDGLTDLSLVVSIVIAEF